ncbi:MAG: hypothetical protein OHK0024_29710 [Thalassobaculales bacterium]
MTKNLVAALILAGSAAAGPALAQPAVLQRDLVDDRPSTLLTAWSGLGRALSWVGGGLSFMVPPSAGDLAASARKEDAASELFRLLGLAGYKLKEIENEVGLIPGIAFKFAIVRELSEADMDYLDEQIERSALRFPGLYGQLERAIVRTVAAINSGGGMQVSDLKLQVLPIPKAAFSVTPTETALGEEASALMRAIQRVERRVRAIGPIELRPSAATQPAPGRAAAPPGTPTAAVPSR